MRSSAIIWSGFGEFRLLRGGGTSANWWIGRFIVLSLLVFWRVLHGVMLGETPDIAQGLLCKSVEPLMLR